MHTPTHVLELDDDDPWPGLASYDEASRRWFHGRDADSAELLRLVRLAPLVMLYGKSGLGKSSMLQAGVFPVLRQERFLPIYLRLDYTETARLDPLEQAALRLHEEIATHGLDAPPPEPGEGLWSYLQRRDRPIWTADNFPVTPVLVFDQFEEVFSRGGSPAHVKTMLEHMGDLVADRLPEQLVEDREAARRLNLQSQQYHVVLSFRSDFLAEVESWAKVANLPRRESLHLTAMSRERAIEAVERAGHAVLAPGMATRIVDFLLQREGGANSSREVEPALLSLCCYQLNRRRQRPARIDEALLQTVGEGILKDFYQEAIEGLDARVSRFVEDNLIQGDRFRSSYPLEGALADGQLTRAELDRLTGNRLLRIDPSGGEPRIELIHDRLVGVVRESRDARRASEREASERAEAQKQDAQRRAAAELEASRLERGKLVRQRFVMGTVMTLMAVGYGGFWYQYDQTQDQLAALGDTRLTLEAQKKAVEDQLRQAQLDLDQRTLELSQARLQLAEAQVDKAGAPAAVRQEAEANYEAARTDYLRAQSQKAQDAAAPPPVVAGKPALLTVSDWRLSSSGCTYGPATVVGQATFGILDRGDEVELVSDYRNGRGDGFVVEGRSMARSKRSTTGWYDIETRRDWRRDGRVVFTTVGVDRLWVSNGAPMRASLYKTRTVCN